MCRLRSKNVAVEVIREITSTLVKRFGISASRLNSWYRTLCLTRARVYTRKRALGVVMPHENLGWFCICMVPSFPHHVKSIVRVHGLSNNASTSVTVDYEVRGTPRGRNEFLEDTGISNGIFYFEARFKNFSRVLKIWNKRVYIAVEKFEVECDLYRNEALLGSRTYFLKNCTFLVSKGHHLGMIWDRSCVS